MSLLAASLALSLLAGAKPPTDKPGCQDHPLFTRLPGYVLSRCETKEFDALELRVPRGPRPRVEGRLTKLTYQVTERDKDQSGLAVVRQYQAALERIGGKVAAVSPGAASWMNGSVTVDGKETWMEVERGNGQVWLAILEKQAMTQHVTADAAALAGGLGASGHVAVEGIFFDTGKAVVKPESRPALEQVAALLQQDPALRLWVVGHTDSVGGAADNLALSEARARAVVLELTSTHGVAAGRLEGRGVGPFAPVASNQDEAGRARNRRVELVKQSP